MGIPSILGFGSGTKFYYVGSLLLIMASDKGVDWAVVLLAIAGGFVGGVLAFKFLFSQPTQAVYEASPKLIQSNAETWEWVDWRGRPRSITVHREVKGHE
jgi:hypothetical protein